MSQTILIADDEPNIVISLEFLLKREGYDVHVARDGEQALAAIRRLRPALVLLDVMMPKMSGYEVCQAVRADPEIAGTRILMLTAKGHTTDRAKGTALGVYNTTQSLGLFFGGAFGGWIQQHWGRPAVFAACAVLMAAWLVVGVGPPRGAG